MVYKFLDKYHDEILRCIKCGACRAVCPTFLEELDESMVTRGRMALIEAVLEGRLDLTGIFKNRISTCITCGSCIPVCPSGVKIEDIILAARAEIAEIKGLDFFTRFILDKIVKSGWALSTFMRFLGIIERTVYGPLSALNVFRGVLPYTGEGRIRTFPEIKGRSLKERYRKKSKRSTWAPEHPKGVAFYTGCNINFVYQDIGMSVINILNKLGFDVILPEGEFCCGAPIRAIGDHKTVLTLTERNFEILSKLDVEAIVTACPTCCLTLKREYPKLLSDPEGMEVFISKIKDINKFIVEKDILSLLVTQHPAVRITYHDPCHLNWGLGISRQPREILKGIHGIDLIEMKNPERCCGFGGIFSFSHYDLSMRIAERKLKSINDTSAEVVVTSCPGCRMHIEDTLRQAGSKIEVKHITQVVDEAI